MSAASHIDLTVAEAEAKPLSRQKVADILSDSTIGLLWNRLSHGRICPFPNQLTGYKLPKQHRDALDGTVAPPTDLAPIASEAKFQIAALRPVGHGHEEGPHINPRINSSKLDLEKANSGLPPGSSEQRISNDTQDASTSPFFVVSEEGDPDNPRNWSFSLVGRVTATLRLSVFDLGYGTAQRVPRIGRNPIYIMGLPLSLIFQFPIILALNLVTSLMYQFLSGLAASPETATVAIEVWWLWVALGPPLGPEMNGYAAQEKGWQWPIWIFLWLSVVAGCIMLVFLPKTFEAALLVRGAERLRKFTGDDRFRAQVEIDA
ncbi:BQ2448_2646 [Microbotryum intermedium]|uniref:BQ2448_2646 protein n=1 Tax=Microbotryum intermedium TaxID=269621 RepID=A0A238FEX3_9BASI|nr:BQ2448_2646 [Microbotryum intermedium]